MLETLFEALLTSSMMTKSSSTYDRLLSAALESFAEYGYHGTSIRAVTEKAGANVAAVNYHFGDKAGLYRCAVEHSMLTCPRVEPAVLEEASCPRDWLRRLLGDVVTYLRSENGTPLMKILVREEMSPTGVLGQLYRDIFMSRHDALVAALVKMTRAREATPELHRLARLLMTNCRSHVHENRARAGMVPGFGPKDEQDAFETLLDESEDLLAGRIRRMAAAGQLS